MYTTDVHKVNQQVVVSASAVKLSEKTKIMLLTESEKRILAKIRQSLPKNHMPYDFWFTYNDNKAYGWEGGFELSKELIFRNKFTLEYKKRIIQNWLE